MLAIVLGLCRHRMGDSIYALNIESVWDCISAQEIFLGGEAPVVRQWVAPTRKVSNAYGPSEATVAVTVAGMYPYGESTLDDVIPGVKFSAGK
ncbi:hypothetical protein GGR53DRAFT_509459 [Hypoxylon sp. FL1150]|nr:hypothetical protein GGR53DRAFT_509459 [Hypoxylon sp. FL1150]